MSNKHSFRAESDSPLGEVIDYLKRHNSLSVQDGVRTGLLALYYPDVLSERDASMEEIFKGLEDSIQTLTGTIERYSRVYQRLQAQQLQSQYGATSADGVSPSPSSSQEDEPVATDNKDNKDEEIPTFLNVSM